MPALLSTTGSNAEGQTELAAHLQVIAVPAFEDNYLWLVRSPRQPEQVLVVDPGDARAVSTTLEREGLQLRGILVTHHHQDHIGGVTSLLAQHEVPIHAPAGEDIPGDPHQVRQGDVVRFDALDLEFQVLDVPGHTAGHVAYYGHGAVFCGDTLFSAGCGRLFEGTAVQMARSLGQLAQLPGDTRVYCAHEYTLANLRFALTVEPDNADAHAHRERCQALRLSGLPTLPSTIDLERRINPFLRLDAETVKRAVARHADRTVGGEVEIFAVLRDWKNHFR